MRLSNLHMSCQLTLKNITALQKTQMYPQSTAFFTCTPCAKTFESKTLLTLHERHHHEHTSPSELHCNQCEGTFQDVVLLNVHMAEHHKDDLYNGEDAQNDDENAGRDPYPDT